MVVETFTLNYKMLASFLLCLPKQISITFYPRFVIFVIVAIIFMIRYDYVKAVLSTEAQVPAFLPYF